MKVRGVTDFRILFVFVFNFIGYKEEFYSFILWLFVIVYLCVFLPLILIRVQRVIY